MGNYAKVVDGIVEAVIVAEQDFIDSLPSEPNVSWIQASYNTYGGVHYADLQQLIPSEDQGKALRKNFPAKGFIYDDVNDAFYRPIPEDLKGVVSLDSQTFTWAMPDEPLPDGVEYIENDA